MIAEASSRDAMLAAIPKLRAFAISLCRITSSAGHSVSGDLRIEGNLLIKQ
jgi:hypothetical protein